MPLRVGLSHGKRGFCGSGNANGSTLSSRTVPVVGRSSVPRMCKSVLLPDPDGPVTANASPRSKVSDTPRKTESEPDRVR